MTKRNFVVLVVYTIYVLPEGLMEYLLGPLFALVGAIIALSSAGLSLSTTPLMEQRLSWRELRM